MTVAKCAKRGCDLAAKGQVMFHDAVRKDLATDWPVSLCRNHLEAAKKFPETDVQGLKAWLNS